MTKGQIHSTSLLKKTPLFLVPSARETNIKLNKMGIFGSTYRWNYGNTDSELAAESFYL
jgi:hypothetical protein